MFANPAGEYDRVESAHRRSESRHFAGDPEGEQVQRLARGESVTFDQRAGYLR